MFFEGVFKVFTYLLHSCSFIVDTHPLQTKHYRYCIAVNKILSYFVPNYTYIAYITSNNVLFVVYLTTLLVAQTESRKMFHIKIIDLSYIQISFYV